MKEISKPLKPLFLFFNFLILAIPTIAQDTTYLDHQWLPIGMDENYTYLQVTRKDSTNPNRLTKFIFLKSGQLSQQTEYFKGSQEIKNGTEYEWYEDGKLKSEIQYSMGGFHGNLITYYQDGTLKRKDYFENEKLIKGQCFDKSGKKTKHFPYLILPSFPGGVPKLYQFLSKNMIYPQDLARAGLEDRVVVHAMHYHYSIQLALVLRVHPFS